MLAVQEDLVRIDHHDVKSPEARQKFKKLNATRRIPQEEEAH